MLLWPWSLTCPLCAAGQGQKVSTVYSFGFVVTGMQGDLIGTNSDCWIRGSERRLVLEKDWRICVWLLLVGFVGEGCSEMFEYCRMNISGQRPFLQLLLQPVACRYREVFIKAHT